MRKVNPLKVWLQETRRRWTGVAPWVLDQGLGIIELLPMIKHFFKLTDNLMAQAEIAKLILSNRSMKDGTLSFSYVNPFDVLVNLTQGQVWWAKARTT